MVSNLAPFGEATMLTNCATITEQYFWASKTVAIRSATHPKLKYYSLIKGKVVTALTNKIILPCSLTQNSSFPSQNQRLVYVMSNKTLKLNRNFLIYLFC